jgi:hypothetical protein
MKYEYYVAFSLTYLVLIRAPHRLDHILGLLLTNIPILGNNLHKLGVNFSRHMRSVAADVEICLLLQEIVDFLGMLLEAVLDIDFARAVAGEGRDELEFVAEGGAVFLVGVSFIFLIGGLEMGFK